MGRHMRFWYLLHRQAAKAQTILGCFARAFNVCIYIIYAALVFKEDFELKQSVPKSHVVAHIAV